MKNEKQPFNEFELEERIRAEFALGVEAVGQVVQIRAGEEQQPDNLSQAA